jgi:hypothetical protein
MGATTRTYIERENGLYYVKTCFVCGVQSEHEEFTMGLPRSYFELDGTPDGPRLDYELHCHEQCPICGYVSFDISEGDERIRELVLSEAYQAQYKDPALPTDLLLGALLVDPCDPDGDSNRCHWELLAAWLCRDGGHAVACRRAAAASLAKVIKADSSLYRKIGKDFVIIADLHRRCGEFAKAAEWVRLGLAGGYDEDIRRQLVLEQSLIEAADTDPHGDWEVPGQASDVMPHPLPDRRTEVEDDIDF